MLQRSPILAPIVIVVAIVAVYANSLSAPFVFDDVAAIVENPTITNLGDLSRVLSPPADGSGVTGRPLVNLTLALDHAVYGLDVRGYRATNIALHALCALVLFGLVRRILTRLNVCPRIGLAPASCALAITLLWALHPLQTETVVCIIQRTESIVSLCYLLTLYSFLRSTEGPRRRWCLGAMIAACCAGMAAKEVMVTAPVMVFLFDRTFIGGTFGEAWRKRWRWHLALASTWIVLFVFLSHAGFQRGTSAGFGLGVPVGDYLLTQCRAIALYLRLSIWPHPLIADYGAVVVHSPFEVLVSGLFVLALLTGTIVALVKRPRLGFLGAWFFGILAPSSSFIPLVTQTIAEHRMYLPLAAVLIVALGGLTRLPRTIAVAACIALTIAGGAATARRNVDYQDEERLWRTDIQHFPESARAHNNLGRVLALAHRGSEAAVEYNEALRLDPKLALTHYNLALLLEDDGKHEEAAAHYGAAANLLPHFAAAELQLGNVRLHQGHPQEALACFQRVLAYDPQLAQAHFSAGLAYAALNRTSDAIAAYSRAVTLDPDLVAAALNLSAAWCNAGQFQDAITELLRIEARHPDRPEVHFNLGVALAQAGRTSEAVTQFGEAVRLRPNDAAARLSYGGGLAQAGNLPLALEQFRQAVALAPDSPEAHANLGNVLWESGFAAEAITHYERALELQPDYVSAHYNLGRALLALGRIDEARHHVVVAVQLAPDYAPAVDLLRHLEDDHSPTSNPHP